MNNKGVRQKLFQPTSTEKGKREKMRRKGVCKITQDGGHLGWGCLVCDSPQVKNTEYFIITSSKAIPKENSDAKKYQKYQVEFEKPSKERKSFQLGEIAKTVHHDVASGLVVIAIDSKSPQLNHGLGKLRERCSVLNDLPNIGCKESGSQFFYIGDKRYDVESDGESLKVSNHDFSCTERCSVLLEDNNMDVKAVGVINLEDNRQRSSVPYWLQESSLKAILGASTTSASDDTDSECRPKGNQPEEQEKEGQNILTEGVTTTKEPVAAVSIDRKPSDDKDEQADAETSVQVKDDITKDRTSGDAKTPVQVKDDNTKDRTCDIQGRDAKIPVQVEDDNTHDRTCDKRRDAKTPVQVEDNNTDDRTSGDGKIPVQVEDNNTNDRAFDEEDTLSLPDEVVKSLSSSCRPKEIVEKLKKILRLDQDSLKQPNPKTKSVIRLLANKAKDKELNRLDVFQYLREITLAGTTGPELPENLPVKSIPFSKRKELTLSLSSRDEWKLVAEKLGVEQVEIDFYNERFKNPFEEVLQHIAPRAKRSVGELYDLLIDCELPVIADYL